MKHRLGGRQRAAAHPVVALAALLFCTVPLSGCLVMGYTSGGGFFIWPGSIVLVVVLALLYFFFLRGH